MFIVCDLLHLQLVQMHTAILSIDMNVTCYVMMSA